ncbi:MAG: VOC family protein [Rhodobacter sp.]|nr:VOC family protein [Rhodobacter sp.]
MNHPILPVGVDHVVFLVADLDRACAFYRDVLNCRPGFAYPDLGMRQVWFGAALIVLWDVTHPGAAAAVPPVAGGRNVDHVCLACGPIDHAALRAHLAALGVAIEREANHGGARGMGASFYIRDPDGNRIELKGPPEHPDLPGPH